MILATGARLALARDSLDIGAMIPAIETRLNGYHTAWVTVPLKDGSACTLPVTFHPHAGDVPPVVLLHGITDSRNAFYKYINRLSDEKQPYKQFLAIDWPRNGDSDCDQVSTPKDAAEVVHRVLDKFLAERGRAAPSRIVGASMGVVLSIYLAAEYPGARLTWITPPVLREPEMSQLIAAVNDSGSRADARDWISKVRTDQRPLPLPRLSYGDAAKRLARGAPIMASIDMEEICRKAGEITQPRRVESIFTGELDRLTPAAAIHPCLSRFQPRIEVKGCAHNIARDCPRSLPVFE